MAEADVLKILSRQELLAYQHKAEGHSRAATAEALRIGRNHVKNLWQSVRRKAKKFSDLPNAAQSPRRSIRPGSLSDCVV